MVPTDAPKGGGTSPGDLSDSESEDKKTGMLKALEKLRAKNAAKAIAKTVKPEAATEAARSVLILLLPPPPQSGRTYHRT